MKWIRDEEFIRAEIPMTKFNVRALTMAYLGIEEGDRFLDIGAGTGSISIEAAAQGAKVTSIETKSLGVDLIRRNAEKFSLNLNIIQGMAPEDLEDEVYDKVFIGGSRGRLDEIFKYLEDHLKSNGILVGNFILLENLQKFINLMKEYGYYDIENNLIQTASMSNIGLFKGENPIYIVKGVKE